MLFKVRKPVQPHNGPQRFAGLRTRSRGVAAPRRVLVFCDEGQTRGRTGLYGAARGAQRYLSAAGLPPTARPSATANRHRFCQPLVDAQAPPRATPRNPARAAGDVMLPTSHEVATEWRRAHPRPADDGQPAASSSAEHRFGVGSITDCSPTRRSGGALSAETDGSDGGYNA